MNISKKAVLASALLSALIAGTSAQAEGRAGGIKDYSQAAATPTANYVKVNVQAPVVKDDIEVNR